MAPRPQSEKASARSGSHSLDPDGVLWAKYLDYCSARFCEAFLGLEEERVFELAQGAEQAAGVSEGRLGFPDIARLLVEQMIGGLGLPDFESWAATYAETPELYDPHLLGLWKSRVPARRGDLRSHRS